MLSAPADPEDASGIPNLDGLPPSSFMSRTQVAKVIDFSIPTLKRWAAEGRGPRITYIEGRPRYRVADIRRWLGGPDA